MSWDKDIEELRRREALADEMGGTDRVARQKASGKLTARQRVDALLDPGSFHETGKIAGKAEYGADNELAAFRATPFVVGRGAIDGRPVCVQADDFTVRFARAVDSGRAASAHRQHGRDGTDGAGAAANSAARAGL
jgi:propionyl-CoA carboxylase beta chain